MTFPLFPATDTTALSAMAFDYGTQKIGVAYGQSLTGTAQAIAVLKANDGIPDWDAIASLISQWQPQVFVVGLPYNMDGTDSELLPRAIKFGNRLNGRFNLPCFGIDERLSTREARAQVEGRGIEGGKKSGGVKKSAASIYAPGDYVHVDAIAAQIILENWFSEWRTRIRSGLSL